MNQEFQYSDQAVIIRSLQEALWGGREGEGILYVVRQMKDVVSDLAKTINVVMTEISDMRSLRSEIARKEQDHVNLYGRLEKIESIKINSSDVEKLLARADKEHEELHKRINHLEEKMDKRSDRGTTTITAWSGIIVSTIISLIALFRGIHT